MTVTELDARRIGATFDCKVADCTDSARSSRGRNAYLCDLHAAQRRRGESRAVRAAAPDSFEGKVRTLLPVARRLDKAREKYLPLAAELRAAHKAWAEAIEALT